MQSELPSQRLHHSKRLASASTGSLSTAQTREARDVLRVAFAVYGVEHRDEVSKLAGETSLRNTGHADCVGMNSAIPPRENGDGCR